MSGATPTQARRFGFGAKRPDPKRYEGRKPASAHPRIALRMMTGKGTINKVSMIGLAGQADLSAYCPPIFDQGESSACTAHSSACGIYATFGFEKKPLGFIPSPDEIYKATRAIARAEANPEAKTLPSLEDDGAEAPDVIAAIAKYGVCAMGPTVEGRQSDVAMSTVNAEPNVIKLADAETTLVAGEYAIDPTATNVGDLVAAALESGFPVWALFFCDTAFGNLTKGQIAGAPSAAEEANPTPNVGGHAVVITGYRKVATGRVWTVRNSWGAEWCNGGTCLASDAWLAACWTLEPWAVSAAPKETAS